MASKINWTRDQILKLLELVEERECLWNVESSDYHNQTKRRKSIAEIADAVSIPEEEVKKKIHTLRAQYSKERAKMKNIKSGSATKEIYKTKWEYYELMKFMFQHTTKNQTMDSMVGITVDTEVDITQDTDYTETVTENETPLESSQLSLETSSVPVTASTEPPSTFESDVRHTPLKKRRLNQNTIDLQEQAAINKCLSVLSKADSKDEYSIFGEHVANELRLLKNTPDLQMKLKHAIQKSILDVSCENAARQFTFVPQISPITSSSTTQSPQESQNSPQEENANTFSNLIQFPSRAQSDPIYSQTFQEL